MDTVDPSREIAIAVRAGSLDAVRRLLDAGARPDQMNIYGDTLIDMARDRGHHDVAALIEDACVRARRVVVSPTHTDHPIHIASETGDLHRVRELLDAAPSLVRNWHTFTLSQGWTKAEYDSARAVWPKVLQFEKLLYDRGVNLTVGTDANNPWTVPGPSYSRELELLVAAGIHPLEVLRLATKAGADALGLRNVGTIQEGQRADLVLLSADPIADIRHTRDIVLVVADGRIAVSVPSGP